MRSSVIENRVTKTGQKSTTFGPPSELVSSHRSLQSRNNQHEYVEFHVIQIRFKYDSSVALQPIRDNETRVTAEMTVF
jgi:hypothetical protein